MVRKGFSVVSLLAVIAVLVTAFLPAGPVSAAANVSLTPPAWVNLSDAMTVRYWVTSITSETHLYFFARVKAATPNAWTLVPGVAPVITPGSSSGSVSVTALPAGVSPVDGQVVEWLAVAAGDTAPTPAATVLSQGSSTVDTLPPSGFVSVAPRQLLQSPNPLPMCQPTTFYALFQDPKTPGTNTFSGLASLGIGLPGQATTITGSPQFAPSEFSFSASNLNLVAAGGLDFSVKDAAGNDSSSAGLVQWPANTMINLCLSFPDVTDPVFAPYIGYLTQIGVIHGYSNTAFGPDDPITRGQFAILIARALNGGVVPSNVAPISGCVFDDVSSRDTELYNAVSWACNHTIITGYGYGLFGPGDALNRGQAVLMLSRTNEAIVSGSLPFDDNHALLAKNLGVAPFHVRTSAFTDVTDLPISQLEMANAINTFYGAGVLDGYNTSEFRIFRSITRAQLAKILYRALSDVAYQVP
jgi:hypothetical protein